MKLADDIKLLILAFRRMNEKDRDFLVRFALASQPGGGNGD